MIVGVPRESLRHEHRVGLTPQGAQRLSGLGHRVYVEHGAGHDSHFADEDFERAGATIAYRAEEVFQRADLVCQVGTVGDAAIEALRPGSTLCGFLHLAVAPKERLARLVDKQATLLGYEVVEDGAGRHPVSAPLAEIAGGVVIQTAAHLLEHEAGGRGILLGGVPGIPPATVVVLGAGKAGRAAAHTALAAGAHVIVLDADLARLRNVHGKLAGRAVTAIATPAEVARYARIADVLVGAVSISGGRRSPCLVTEDTVRAMKPGSIIIDLSIDQGGCVETSRPTTLDTPTFQLHGVTHCCVPNLTANVPRTSARALTLAALPYLERLAEDGVACALAADAGLARGVFVYRGRVVNEAVARALGRAAEPLAPLLRAPPEGGP